MYTIIPEVAEVLIHVLKDTYGPLPRNNDWHVISQDFQEFWNLPNCIGALDSKHFKIDHPPHSGSICFNYKKVFSVLLSAICDADRRIIWSNIGDYGKIMK